MQCNKIFITLVLGVCLASAYPQDQEHGLLKGITKHTNRSTVLSSHLESKIRIYNGNDTTINTHRYLVGIIDNGSFKCAGAIVSENWVISTATCTTPLTSEAAVVGSSSNGVFGITFPVTQIVIHPEYNPRTNSWDYDYACLQVNGTFYYWRKRSLHLPKNEPRDFMNMMVAGYGDTSSVATNRELRKASMNWLPKSVCEKYYTGLAWTDRMACANSSEKATLCTGDKGDSFVVGKTLYGQFITVATEGFCTSSALPVILSDIYVVAQWIHEITGASYQ